MAFKSTNYMFLSKIYGPASGGADLVAYNYFTRLQTGVTYEYSYTRNWIAIGQQQWGYIQQPKGTPESSYPLPTNFTTLYMTGCCANRGAWYLDTVSFSATLTTITISTATGNVAVGYILVGMQQWGIAETSGSSAQAQVAFNIQFSTKAFSVIVTGTEDNDSTALNGLASTESFEASNVTCASSVVNKNTTFYWYAIGRQQKHINSCHSHFRKFEMLCLLLLFQRC